MALIWKETQLYSTVFYCLELAPGISATVHNSGGRYLARIFGKTIDFYDTLEEAQDHAQDVLVSRVKEAHANLSD